MIVNKSSHRRCSTESLTWTDDENKRVQYVSYSTMQYHTVLLCCVYNRLEVLIPHFMVTRTPFLMTRLNKRDAGRCQMGNLNAAKIHEDRCLSVRTYNTTYIPVFEVAKVLYMLSRTEKSKTWSLYSSHSGHCLCPFIHCGIWILFKIVARTMVKRLVQMSLSS